MKDEDVLAFIPIFIVGFVLGAGLIMILFIFRIGDVEKENEELKTKNTKLEHQLLELYQEQAERTKKTAEKNGVGG
mgnify:CR=1 FL=1